MQKIYLIVFISCFLLISCFETPKESNIYLHDFTIDTTIEQRKNNFPNYLTTWVSSLISPWIDDTTTIHSYLIKTDPTFSLQDVQSELASLGIKIGDYVPYHSFIVSATQSQIRKAKLVKGVKWIGSYDSHHKTKIKIKHSTSRKLLSKEEVILFVSVAKHSNREDLKKVADEWTEEIKKLVGDAFINMLVVSNDKIAMSVLGESAADQAKNFLINQGLVHWVEKKPPTVTHNKHSSMLVQSYKRKNDRPAWKRGLTGKGQIIGVGDTGLDYNHCFFHDDKHEVPIQRTMIDKNVKHNGHRKIHSLWAYMDQIDDESGHGSHVSGIAAGSAHESLSPKNLSYYNSLAKDALLSFIDCGCGTPGGCKCPPGTQCECQLKYDNTCPKKIGIVYLPLNLNEDYFPFFYEKGARVVSCSWGTGYYHDFNYGYSISSSEIDTFTWKHKDFLPVFAAGNSGGEYGYVSLTAESNSKNSLSVGSSQSSLASFKDNIRFTDYDAAADRIKAQLVDFYCAASSPSKNSTQCQKAKRFSVEKCCDLSEPKKCNPISATCCGTQEFPEFPYSKKIGFQCCKECIFYEFEHAPEHHNENNMAHFSGRGPTLDGRIKPDVVTVGDYIVSSRAGRGKCKASGDYSDWLIKHEGTSMSAPLAAAAAVLVRQFYVNGYYPSGNPRSVDGFEPSAALVKATLIHSTEVLDGLIYLFSKHEWYPLIMKDEDPKYKFALMNQYFQGFGRINLENVFEPDAGLYIPYKKDRSIKTGQLHKFCMRVKSAKKPFKVTLTWTDPPSSPAARINLVNDLDLIVVSPDDTKHFGNGQNSPIGVKRIEPDYVNNVEQVFLNGMHPGKYLVVVRGRAVPFGPQPYALIMSGDIETSTDCHDYDDNGIPQVVNEYRNTMYVMIILCGLVIPVLALVVFYFYFQYRKLIKKYRRGGEELLEEEEF